eukprot:gene24071-9647_t
MAGLYMGQWMSQDVVRNAAGGELLVGTENVLPALQSGSKYTSTKAMWLLPDCTSCSAKETFPIEVSVPSWKEPDYSEEDQLFETPILFTASVTVSGLTSGQTYSVYRFDDRQTLPSSNFAREGYAKTVVFTATGSSYSFSDSFISSASVFYRAVL